MKCSSATGSSKGPLLSYWFWYVSLLLIVIEAFFWTSGGSGVSRIRYFFFYPEGFNLIIDDAVVGRFTIQKEDLRYITQYFSFLRNDVFGISQDWPAQRNLYSLLVSGMWPVGFVLGGALVNLLFWIGAAVSAWKMTELVGVTSTLGRGTAVLLVIFHQGFLWSVGETNPHASGYASGFLILGAIAHQRALEAESRIRDLMPIAALAGILCLFYHAALLYLPMLFVIMLRKILQDVRAKGWATPQKAIRRTSEVAVLGLFVLGPSLLFSELLTWLGLLTRHSSTAGVLYLQMLPTFLNESSNMVSAAFFAFLAGFNAFGPFLLVPMLVGALMCLRSGDWRRRSVVFYLFAVMVFLIPNFLLGEPGYASVHLIPLVVMLAVIGLESIFLFLARRTARGAEIAALIYVGSLATYVNAPLVGVPFPLHLGWSGYMCVSDCSTDPRRVRLHGYLEERF